MSFCMYIHTYLSSIDANMIVMAHSLMHGFNQQGV